MLIFSILAHKNVKTKAFHGRENHSRSMGWQRTCGYCLDFKAFTSTDKAALNNRTAHKEKLKIAEQHERTIFARVKQRFMMVAKVMPNFVLPYKNILILHIIKNVSSIAQRTTRKTKLYLSFSSFRRSGKTNSHSARTTMH